MIIYHNISLICQVIFNSEQPGRRRRSCTCPLRGKDVRRTERGLYIISHALRRVNFHPAQLNLLKSILNFVTSITFSSIFCDIHHTFYVTRLTFPVILNPS